MLVSYLIYLIFTIFDVLDVLLRMASSLRLLRPPNVSCLVMGHSKPLDGGTCEYLCFGMLSRDSRRRFLGPFALGPRVLTLLQLKALPGKKKTK